MCHLKMHGVISYITACGHTSIISRPECVDVITDVISMTYRVFHAAANLVCVLIYPLENL